MVGEFRVHYAGFFDPGFGHDAAGGSGSRGVLEVRCHEAPFVLFSVAVPPRRLQERSMPTRRSGISLDIVLCAMKLSRKQHQDTAHAHSR